MKQNIDSFYLSGNKLFQIISEQVWKYWQEYEKLDPIYKFCIDEGNRFGWESKNFIYFLRNKYNNYIKIGYSQDIRKRVKSINSVILNYLGACDMVEIIGIIDTSFIHPKEFEKFLHYKYRIYNKFGEWFDFPDNVLNQIIKEYFFDMIYDHTINFPYMEELNLKENQIHGIGIIGSPNDKDFSDFLYDRYKINYRPTKKDILNISMQIAKDVFGIESIPITKSIFDKSFYDFALLEYVKDNIENLSLAWNVLPISNDIRISSHVKHTGYYPQI